MEKVLRTAADEHSIRNALVLPVSNPVVGSPNSSNKLETLFYLANNETSRRGMGSSESPPVVVAWDVATSSVKFELHGHTDHIMSVGFSPNNKFIASASSDETLRVWDVNSGVCIRKISCQKDNIGLYASRRTQRWSL